MAHAKQVDTVAVDYVTVNADIVEGNPTLNKAA